MVQEPTTCSAVGASHRWASFCATQVLTTLAHKPCDSTASRPPDDGRCALAALLCAWRSSAPGPSHAEFCCRPWLAEPRSWLWPTLLESRLVPRPPAWE